MGILDNVERRLEKALRGAFSVGSRSLQPVEIASHIRKEVDDKALALSEGRTVVPNVVDVQLGDVDFERARSWGAPLAEELCDVLIQHAVSQGYTLPGPVRVSFTHNGELKAGEPKILSRVEKSSKDGGSQAYASSAPLASSPGEPSPPSRGMGSPAGSQAVLEIDGHRYSLNASSVVLGRSSEADVLIDDSGVSRRHLEIRVNAGEAVAFDLGSTNGSFLDGRRIHGSATLHDGAVVTIGRARLTFRWVDNTAGGRL